MSPIGDFRWNFSRQIFFPLTMATKMIAAWSAVFHIRVQRKKQFYFQAVAIMKSNTNATLRFNSN